jgi:hypothetical protein
LQKISKRLPNKTVPKTSSASFLKHTKTSKEKCEDQTKTTSAILPSSL